MLGTSVFMKSNHFCACLVCVSHVHLRNLFDLVYLVRAARKMERHVPQSFSGHSTDETRSNLHVRSHGGFVEIFNLSASYVLSIHRKTFVSVGVDDKHFEFDFFLFLHFGNYFLIALGFALFLKPQFWGRFCLFEEAVNDAVNVVLFSFRKWCIHCPLSSLCRSLSLTICLSLSPCNGNANGQGRYSRSYMDVCWRPQLDSLDNGMCCSPACGKQVWEKTFETPRFLTSCFAASFSWFLDEGLRHFLQLVVLSFILAVLCAALNPTALPRRIIFYLGRSLGRLKFVVFSAR